MKILSIIILLNYCFSASAQNKQLYNIVNLNGDTSFWYKNQVDVAKKISQPLLDTSTAVDYIRIWTDGQVINIWQTVESGPLAGTLVTWANESVSENETNTHRTFSKTKILNADTLDDLKNLIMSTKILDLPTDGSISGWKQGLDGITYKIEHLTKNFYSFKTYWTPQVQDSLKEGQQVQSFIDDAFKLVNAKKVLNDFTKEIPFEMYNYDGSVNIRKVVSKKQRKKYLKERKIFRQRQIYLSQGERI